MAERDGRERIPRSLQGLLRMTTEQAEKPSPTVFDEMSEERKEWLKKAISQFSEDTFVKRMQECLKVLQDIDNDDDAVKESAFEQLQSMVDLIDNANDLHKIGGFPIVVKYLNNNQSAMRWRAADLIAVLCQNNPYSQVHLNQLGVIPTLLHLLDNDPIDQVRIKSLYALSCLISNFPDGKKAFLDLDGLSALIRALQENILKVRTKSASMLRSMISESTDSKVKETLVDMGIVEQLVCLLHEPHEIFHEYILDALVILADSQPKVVQECQRSDLHLEKVLHDKMQDKDAFETEIDYCKSLLKLCFGSKTANDNTLR